MRSKSRSHTNNKGIDVKHVSNSSKDRRRLGFSEEFLGSTWQKEQANAHNLSALDYYRKTLFTSKTCQTQIPSGKPCTRSSSDRCEKMSSMKLELYSEDSSSNSAGYIDNTSGGEDTLDLAHSSAEPRASSLNDQYEGFYCKSDDMSRVKKRKFSSDSTGLGVRKEEGEEDWTLQKWKQYYKQRAGCKRSRKSRSLKLILEKGTDKPDTDVQCLPTLDSGVCCVTDPVRGNSVIEDSNSRQGDDSKVMKENSDIATSNIRDCHQPYISDDEDNSVDIPKTSSVINLELEDDSDNDKSYYLSEHMQEDDACSWGLNQCVDNRISLIQSRPSFNSPISVKKHKSISSKKVTRITEKKSLNLFMPKCSKTVLLETNANYSMKCSDTHSSETNNAEVDQCENNNSFDISVERFEIEENYDFRLKPTQIPCKRKAISPLSQEMLLRASRLDEFGYHIEKREMKKRPHSSKGSAWDNDNDENCPDFSHCVLSDVPHTSEKFARNVQSLQGSHFGNHRKPLLLKFKSPINISSLPTSKSLVEQSSHDAFSNVQDLSLVLQNSPSTCLETVVNTSHVSSSPSPHMPVKGILRSSLESCKDQCHCEKCASVRLRAKKASEFSQRQMQDIEGIAAMLMKDLGKLRGIIEDKLIKNSAKAEDIHSNLVVDEVKIAASNALETEETAKKWLVRMSRDSNRYCKIMRMQERKLTFADEKGGKLCHIRVFNSEPTESERVAVFGPEESDV